MRISTVNVLLNLPAFYRKELEFPPDFLGRKGGAYYAPVRLIDTKRRYIRYIQISLILNIVLVIILLI